MTSRRSFPSYSKASCKMCSHRGHPLRGKEPQPQKLTASMLLPGTSSASEWRDLLQSRRQFWPTLTHRHASLVPVSAEALQRERRQMQAKHLWYNVDIRWVDLKEKLEVLAPTGLTRDDIWRHLFLTKQCKNPYEEGCYTGEDLEDVERKWEAKQKYFLEYKKDGSNPCIDLAMALHGFDIDNTAAYHAIEDSKTLHARRWQTKEGIYRIKRQALPDVRSLVRLCSKKKKKQKKEPSAQVNSSVPKHSTTVQCSPVKIYCTGNQSTVCTHVLLNEVAT